MSTIDNVTRSTSPSRSRHNRVKLVDIVLIPCYIPVACIVCVVLGTQCLWSVCSGRPVGYFGDGNQSALCEHAEQQLRKKDEQLLRKEAPRKLPAVRKRALSIPLPPSDTPFWRQKQKTVDQLQSPLFGRLPLEVRHLIFNYYLTPDGQPMHIFRRTDKRLGHCFCTFGPESHSHYPKSDWGYDNPSRTRAWKKNKSDKPVYSSNLLPLLKTCRRT